MKRLDILTRIFGYIKYLYEPKHNPYFYFEQHLLIHLPLAVVKNAIFNVAVNYVTSSIYETSGGAVALWLLGRLSPGRGPCVVFLGKTLYSYRASLHPGVQMGTSKYAGGNPAID